MQKNAGKESQLFNFFIYSICILIFLMIIFDFYTQYALFAYTTWLVPLLGSNFYFFSL